MIRERVKSIHACAWEICDGLPVVDDLAHILQTCRKDQDVGHALYWHAFMCNVGLETHTTLGNILALLMVEVGCMHYAQQVFDKLVCRSERTWTCLIGGYIDCGMIQEAFNLYTNLEKDDLVHPSGYTFVALLKACSSLKDLKKGSVIHAEVSRKGLIERDPFVASMLVDMYVKCGCFLTAQGVLYKLPHRDVVCWTALIAGYAEHGHGKEALECFTQMQQEGVNANTTTLVCCLKACGGLGNVGIGLELHAEIERKWCLKKDIMLGTALVDMYCKYGLLGHAQEVFDTLCDRNAVCWTTLIVGYVEHGFGEVALACFHEMVGEGISPDIVTLVSTLKACGNVGATDKGLEIHANIERQGLLARETTLGNTLMDMYIKCGSLAKAQEIFDKLPERSIVSWTALLMGYGGSLHSDKALECFEGMRLDGFSPDTVALMCVLQACGMVGAPDRGLEVHAEIERRGEFYKDVLIGNTLVDMYAKCGFLSKAQDVFDMLPQRDVVSWTALMAGYAQIGEIGKVCNIFERMLGGAVKPDPVIFLIVLDACSRTGLCDKSELFYEAMGKTYGIIPSLEHDTGMVGLFCRIGQLERAVAILKRIPAPSLVMWHMVLNACRSLGNAELGKQAFKHAVLLDGSDAAAYALMSHVYVDSIISGLTNESSGINHSSYLP